MAVHSGRSALLRCLCKQHNICRSIHPNRGLPLPRPCNVPVGSQGQSMSVHTAIKLRPKTLCNTHTGSTLQSVPCRHFSKSGIGQRRTSSALYVGPEDNNVAVVDLDLNLDDRLRHHKQLEYNLKARHHGKPGKTVNLVTLVTQYQNIKEICRKQAELELEREDIANVMKHLVKEKGMSKSAPEFVKIANRGREVRKELKTVNRQLAEVEEEVMCNALRLPADLHPTTPKEDEIVEEFGPKPVFNFRVKSHIELGRRTRTLVLSSVSPGAYYFRNEIAILELDLQDIFSHILAQQGFQQYSNPDMVKTFIMEACGQEFENPEKVFTMQPRVGEQKADQDSDREHGRDVHKWDNTFHLCGGASPYSFIAYLTKMNIEDKCLPFHWFSVGRYYSPVADHKYKSEGLFSVPQSLRAEIFGAARNSEEATYLYEEYTKLLWDIYKVMELPIRLVKIGIPNLQPQEGGRREIQVWSPSLKTYKKIASVSVWNDFASRRLMIRHSQDTSDITSRNFVHTVHGTALSVPQLAAAFMENNQTQEGKFEISHKLHASKKKCVYIMTPR